MATARLSRLQRRILAWLWAEDPRPRGTMAADHRDLVLALAHHRGNLSHSLRNLAAKGLVTLTKTPGGKIEAVALTAAGRTRAEVLNNGLNRGTAWQRVWGDFPVEEYEALREHAGRDLRTVPTYIRVLVREELSRLTPRTDLRRTTHMPDYWSILPKAVQLKAVCGACGAPDVTVPHIHTTTLEQDAYGQWHSSLIFTLNCQPCQAVSYLVMDAITGQVKAVSLPDPA